MWDKGKTNIEQKKKPRSAFCRTNFAIETTLFFQLFISLAKLYTQNFQNLKNINPENYHKIWVTTRRSAEQKPLLLVHQNPHTTTHTSLIAKPTLKPKTRPPQFLNHPHLVDLEPTCHLEPILTSLVFHRATTGHTAVSNRSQHLSLTRIKPISASLYLYPRSNPSNKDPKPLREGFSRERKRAKIKVLPYIYN